MPDYWEDHDRALYTHSRQGFVAGRYGACFPFPGVPAPPALRPRWPGKGVVLPDPWPLTGYHVLADGRTVRACLGAVMARRKSEREPKGCDARSLATLLDLFSVTERVPGDAYESLRKAMPSGGGMHSLECYAAVSACEGLQAGLYWLSPAEGHVVMVSGLTPEVGALLGGAAQSAGVKHWPAVLLVMAARFARVQHKYRRICLATILKDCGVAMGYLSLIATALDLHATPIGGGDSELFGRATGLDPWVEGSVGEVAIW